MKTLLIVAVFVTAQQVVRSQTVPSIPTWLASYPGVTAENSAFPGLVQSSYKTPADLSAVVEHYRGLFATQNLPFLPNPDGIGTVIRAATADSDLLITIHPQGNTTFVEVSSAAKSKSSSGDTALPQVIAPATRAPSRISTQRSATQRTSPSRIPPPSKMLTEAESVQRHKQLVEEMGIHKTYTDAPAPPLVWPSWLVHLRGAPLKIQQGVDQSKNDYLSSTFTTSAPMTEIYSFYEDLLNVNGHHVHNAKLGTGQTISGITQNADGYVEGTNHPNGSPGPYTRIRVTFSRFILNEPIKVRISFTPHAFKAPKRPF